MNYEQLEEDIVARLSPLLDAGFDVVALPEVEAEYTQPIAKGKVTVAYKESSFPGGVKGTSEIVQEEQVTTELFLQCTKLRGSAGIYNLIKLVKARLVGFRPTDCNRLHLTKLGFIEKIDNLWTYTLHLQCMSMVIEQPDDVVEVLLKRIVLDNETTEDQVVIGDQLPDVSLAFDYTFDFNIQ